MSCPKQPISHGQMTLALIKLPFIPATSPLVGPTANYLEAWHHSSTWAPFGLQAWALGLPWKSGRLPGPFIGGSVLEGHKAQVTGKSHPTHCPGLVVRPDLQPSEGGRGSYRPALSTSNTYQRPGGQARVPVTEGDPLPSLGAGPTRRAVVPRHPRMVGLRSAHSPQCLSLGRTFH